jgi:FtsP/CotA-like multicopper oxidase with cupredoxin domain
MRRIVARSARGMVTPSARAARNGLRYCRRAAPRPSLSPPLLVTPLPPKRRLLWTLPAVLLVGGCGDASPTSATPRAGPDPWASALRVAPAVDRNPDPRVVEIDLEARMAEWEYAPGRTVHAMTYNGSVPGPTIEARVGDTLVVHFTNRLAEPTTIHWHGLRVPADMDGSPRSQQPVAPGASFEYRFTLPDAGTYWYHPHANEARQMEAGLYGAIVVRGADEPSADVEGVLVLDDLTLGDDGQIAPPGDLLEIHSGRDGGLQVINGRAGATLPMRSGQRQRWRIINAGSARFYRLALPGHRFTVIGTDGGSLPAPRLVDELLLVPGDRYDVLVDAVAAPGARATLRNLPYDRGHGAGVFEAADVLGVAYASDPALPSLPTPTVARAIDAIDTAGVTPVEVRLSEQIDEATQSIRFMINGASWPDVPALHASVGRTTVWDVVNESEMDHPIHLHGFFFQVVSRNGVPEPARSWEDTVDLRGHERLRIAFRPDDRPGMWMFHCHILEHVDHGMMADLMVER